jgi:hypothetical protein
LPALKTLDLTTGISLFTRGFTGLAQALFKASRSNWAHLNLSYVELGDEGVAMLATLISQGRLEQLEGIVLYDNGGVTNEGIILLAQAINGNGLPALTNFRMVCFNKEKITLLGIGALAHAVLNGCPELREIYLTKPASDEGVSEPIYDMIEGMLRGAGRDGAVRVLDNFYG